MSATDTPMMRQYLELKAQVPDALLLYRMGDFYELFLDDAVTGAEIMELTLTSRNKNDPDPIPMCGVPYHALDAYMAKLLEAGRKVAIAEQVDTPAPVKGRMLMDRELVRVVTPGIPWDPEGLDAREPCWLACLFGRGPVGLVLLDTSTGELRGAELDNLAAAANELSRYEPKELLLDPATADDPALAGLVGRIPHTVPDPSSFDRAPAKRLLLDVLGVTDLLGYGVPDHSTIIPAAGAALGYARDTARADLRHVRSLITWSSGGHLLLDEATRRNLEILRPLTGTGRKGTLLGLLDRSATPMGGRLLREWLGRPLAEVEPIRRRQEGVEALLDSSLRRAVRDALRAIADLERLGGKVAQATANARDLVSLATSLRRLPELARLLAGKPALAGAMPEDLLADLADDIETWLVDEPPTAITEGGLIRRGVRPDLDELADLSMEGKGAIARMEARERDRTGINSLKIRHNRVFGYYIEITAANLDRVPNDWFRKQTLVNAERFITPELKDFEEKVLGADDQRRTLEHSLFLELRERVAGHMGRIQAAARRVALLDVLGALAEVAVLHRYVRPEMDSSADLEIVAGRHPVVESMGGEERFVPNDLALREDRRLVILTGPNMAGKSTVMRQIALIALMAQLGSFVPAERARIGLCDRIFVRVGASDDLARGRSTFMVEMSETALILNQASSRSLILLDEIGRGTSTYDGLAIAWAVAEAVHDRVRARTLFATHYHELIALGEDLPRATNLHIAVSEWGERIIFLRTLREGGASRSYGIQCARLAGLPDAVIERARTLLAELERRPKAGPPTRQLGLFGAVPDERAGDKSPATPARKAPPPAAEALLKELGKVDPNDLSPRAALDLLFKLKELASKAA